MPAYKGTKVLGTLSGGVHRKGTAPVAGMYGAYGPRTTDKKMINKPTLTKKDKNDTYARALNSSDTTNRKKLKKKTK